MEQHRTVLARTFEFFTYLILCIFFAFHIELFLAIHLPSQISFIIILLRAYFYGGLLGSVLELVATETLFLERSGFHRNALKFWPAFLIADILPPIAAQLTTLAPPWNSTLAQHLSRGIFEIIALVILCLWMLRKKYGTDSLKPTENRRFMITRIGPLALFYLLSLINVFLAKNVFPENHYALFILLLSSQFLHLLEFLYLSILMVDRYPAIRSRFNKRKEVYMINPRFGGIFKGLFSALFPNYPPFFVVLKALTPREYGFRGFNKKFWQNRYYNPDKLVAITCYSSNSYEAYTIAKEYKRRGSTVVMGGPHVTYLPNEALEYCDSVVIGDAEGVWPDIIRDYENNRLQPQYSGPVNEASRIAVHQELLNSPAHIIKDFIEPTRGCKFRCAFCTIPMLAGGKVTKKPVEEIVALIKKARPRYRNFTLLDNNIYNDPAYSKKLFKALIPLDITWHSFCTIDIAKNTELLKLAKKSGCRVLVFGYEISGNSLEGRRGGKLAMAGRYLRYSKIVKNHGINIKGNFIFGWDSDNVKSLWQLWRFCLALRPVQSVIAFLTPLPGSQLYYQMLKEDRLTNLNWKYYDDLSCVFKHPLPHTRVLAKAFSPIINTAFLMGSSQMGLALSVILGLCLFLFAMII